MEGYGKPKPKVGLPKGQTLGQTPQLQNVRHGFSQKHVTLRRANLAVAIEFKPQFPIAVNDLPFLFEKEVPGLPSRTQTASQHRLGLRMERLDSPRDLRSRATCGYAACMLAAAVWTSISFLSLSAS